MRVMTLTSSAFSDGGVIPARFAQTGRDVSPALSWSGAPDSTRSFVLLVHDAEAALVRRIFEGFVETESGTKLVQALRSDGHLTKRGREFTKSDVYRVLSNRTYRGEAMHKGKSYPGEHAAIVPQAMWDAAHALLTISPRTRANRTRHEWS